MLIEIIIVMLGGSIGAVARYLIGNWSANRLGIDFPYGTLLVNIAGCFLMGIIMTLITEKMHTHANVKLLLTVGFLGALTTFSSFSYETLHLLETNRPIPVLLNIFANVSGGLLAAWLGTAIVRLI